MSGEAKRVSRRNFIYAGLGAIALAAIGVKEIVFRVNTISELPGADKETGNLLSSMLMEGGRAIGSTLNFEAANEDLEKILAETSALAEQILAEASAVAEQRMKEKFPETSAGEA